MGQRIRHTSSNGMNMSKEAVVILCCACFLAGYIFKMMEVM